MCKQIQWNLVYIQLIPVPFCRIKTSFKKISVILISWIIFTRGPYLYIRISWKHETWYSGSVPPEFLKNYSSQTPIRQYLLCKYWKSIHHFQRVLSVDRKKHFSILFSVSEGKKGLPCAHKMRKMRRRYGATNVPKIIFFHINVHYELWSHQSKCWRRHFLLVMINNW